MPIFLRYRKEGLTPLWFLSTCFFSFGKVNLGLEIPHGSVTLPVLSKYVVIVSLEWTKVSNEVPAKFERQFNYEMKITRQTLTDASSS